MRLARYTPQLNLPCVGAAAYHEREQKREEATPDEAHGHDEGDKGIDDDVVSRTEKEKGRKAQWRG